LWKRDGNVRGRTLSYVQAPLAMLQPSVEGGAIGHINSGTEEKIRNKETNY
jgi:hypothetical protein